jgi:membrane-bound lytic murein transglycosylase B
MKFKKSVLLALLLSTQLAQAEIANTDSFNGFIHKMVSQHHFNEAQLRQLFKTVEIQQPILDAMSKPAEAKPWFQYRDIFMTETRIAGGVQFWQDNQAALTAVEQQYGVPAEIIIAIIGVETKYGANTGKYRVIDALSTLGFAYPKRSEFFLKELEQYLLLTRDEQIDPLSLNGSYAGAMGFPQFMPSSFRRYAVDFDGNQQRDIWHSKTDIIGSVAQYFAAHHWQKGHPIAVPMTAENNLYKAKITPNLKPDLRLAELESLNLKISVPLALSEKIKILELKQEQSEELWAVLENFYVITRYNHSPLYAMAVYQLSQSILNKKGSFP